MCFIFSNNINKIDIYTYICDKLIKAEFNLNIFNDINFSNQFMLSEKNVNDIIITTDIFINYYIINNIDISILFNNIYKIIKKIKSLNTSTDLKISLYLLYLKTNNNDFNLRKFNILINNVKKI